MSPDPVAMDASSDVTTRAPLLSVRDLHKRFDRRRGVAQVLKGERRAGIEAVDGVGFDVAPGEVLGLAGESGSGKSVTGELIAALQAPDSGQVVFEGVDVSTHTRQQRKEFRRRLSMVFQDPYDALNPRLQIRQAVAEPLQVNHMGSGADRTQRVLEMLDRVGLRPADHYARRYPHQLSGGERQRAAIARALITSPRLLIADEPTTMLDVSVRTGLLNLLREMTAGDELAMIFISHDFTTLSYLCDRIVIIYLGRVAEAGPAQAVLTGGLHPYTQLLSSAIPVPDPDAGRTRVRTTIDVGQPSREACLFAPRCPHRMERCTTVVPDLLEERAGHAVACHLYPSHMEQPSPEPAPR